MEKISLSESTTWKLEIYNITPPLGKLCFSDNSQTLHADSGISALHVSQLWRPRLSIKCGNSADSS